MVPASSWVLLVLTDFKRTFPCCLYAKEILLLACSLSTGNIILTKWHWMWGRIVSLFWCCSQYCLSVSSRDLFVFIGECLLQSLSLSWVMSTLVVLSHNPSPLKKQPSASLRQLISLRDDPALQGRQRQGCLITPSSRYGQKRLTVMGTFLISMLWPEFAVKKNKYVPVTACSPK